MSWKWRGCVASRASFSFTVPHKLYSPSVLASCNRFNACPRFFLFFLFFFYGIETLEMFYITLCIFIFYVKKRKQEKNTGEKELIVTVKIKDDLINFLTVSCWVPSGKTRGWGEDEQTVHITHPCDKVHKPIVRNSPLDKQFVIENVWVFIPVIKVLSKWKVVWVA